jgi:hypothetical protein
MTGGLIELKSKNTLSILTDNSKSGITFFKSVYIRRSYFVIEPTLISFDTYTNFGTTSSVELPTPADLINKMYVRVELPSLPKKEKNNIENINLTVINNFIKISKIAYIKFQELLICDNVCDIEFIKSTIKSSFQNETFTDFKNILKNTVYKYNDVSIYQICSIPNIDLPTLGRKIKIAMKILINIYNFEINISNKSDNIKWVKNVGIELIKEARIYIGEQLIVSHDREWLRLYFNIFNDSSLKKAYDNMINSKNVLFIPLRFWFTMNIKNSLVLPSLQKIRIEIDFENAEKLVTSKCKNRLNMKAELLVDFIHLDNKDKFLVREDQEILIEQLELMKFNISLRDAPYILDNFNKPSKELIWIIKKSDESLCFIKKCGIKYQDEDRTPFVSGKFYDALMPWYFHINSSKKIYLYPFALFQDPSGFSNLSPQYYKVSLRIKLNKDICFDKSQLYVFSRGMNYLTYSKGYVKLKYV